MVEKDWIVPFPSLGLSFFRSIFENSKDTKTYFLHKTGKIKHIFFALLIFQNKKQYLKTVTKGAEND